MPDWDEDSPQLRESLTRVLHRIRDEAHQRKRPTVQASRQWHAEMMRGLEPEDSEIRRTFRGVFRGESGLESDNVRVGQNLALPARDVGAAFRRFEAYVQREVRLDALLAPGAEPNASTLGEILNLCAWAHAEWVRIHPFANGNGRTARMWANSIAMRYGLPPFVRLRPRPDSSYGVVGARAMRGHWKSTATLFRRMLKEFLFLGDADGEA